MTDDPWDHINSFRRDVAMPRIPRRIVPRASSAIASLSSTAQAQQLVGPETTNDHDHQTGYYSRQDAAKEAEDKHSTTIRLWSGGDRHKRSE